MFRNRANGLEWLFKSKRRIGLGIVALRHKKHTVFIKGILLNDGKFLITCEGSGDEDRRGEKEDS